MISDEKRRDVAQKLRGLPIDMYSTIDEWEKYGLFINNSVSDEGDYSQIHDAVFGCFPAEYMHPGDYEELHERLADLIDRPTATATMDYEAMEDGIPDCRIWTCNRCKESFPAYRGFYPTYCPVCGTEFRYGD